MLKFEGKVIARYRGTYTTRDGEIKPKIMYAMIDEKGEMFRITDFNLMDEPYSVDEVCCLPVAVSTYLRDGQPRFNFVLANTFQSGMTSF